MSDAFLGWYFAHPDEHLANGDGRPIVLGETHRRSGRGGSSSFLWLTKPQSLPNRLLNRSSNFLFEGRRSVLCSESNLG